MSTYRPLPSQLTITQSGIEGLGLFAVEDIKSDTDLGLTHIVDETKLNGFIRTPLGGFINHNTTPNCKTFTEGRLISIITLKDIKEGEELTLKYTMYDPSQYSRT